MEHFADLVKKATPIQETNAVLKASNIKGDVRILYRDQQNFEQIASQFGIFEEWKVIVVTVVFLSYFSQLVCHNTN